MSDEQWDYPEPEVILSGGPESVLCEPPLEMPRSGPVGFVYVPRHRKNHGGTDA